MSVTGETSSTQRAIILGGYAAKQCPVRTHNDYSPLVPAVEWEPSPELQAEFDAGNEFEAEVFAELLRIHPDAVLVDPELRRRAAISTTLAAMESGAHLILGGWLPDDTSGGRKGKPDILIAVGGGYLPADVKHHGTAKAAKKKTTEVSTFTQPANRRDVMGLSNNPHHYEDGMQLAHYTRMLQSCGFHPGDHLLLGAVLGTTQLQLSGANPELVFVWHDLTEPVHDTFSRREGKVRRSLLDCYDYEHASRIEVAATAARIIGSPDDPAALVIPIGQDECARCPYELWCAEQMGPEDASVAITGSRPDTREWRALRKAGRGTVSTLAELNPAEREFFEPYYLRVSHRSRDQAMKRVQVAVQQARMIRDGVTIAPIEPTSVEIPAADVEIDFDIEWDTAGRIYQWGLRVRDGQDDTTARYEPVVSFEHLDDDGEHALAEQAADQIMALRDKAQRENKTLAIYHWSHVEVSRTRKFRRVAAALDGVTVDLHPWFTETFHVRGGAGIKNVATLLGFSWSVDDPGGRVSLDKIDLARAGGDDAHESRQWCLRYNESDVAAQATIRDALRHRRFG
jgi:predicted RecB family nuclease